MTSPPTPPDLLFPPIEPIDSGWLPVSGGHHLYWERCGRADGRPTLFLHGGPGAGCSVNQRRLFDPARDLIVLFDQRGAGRSSPRAEEPEHDLSVQTLDHLIEDIEALRAHLKVDRWVILGMSWGTTLALAYAQRHPQRIAGLVLALVTTTSRREVQWMTEDVGRLFPEAWARFQGAIPTRWRGLPIVDAYAEWLALPSSEAQAAAAAAWCAWEDAHVSLTPGHQPSPRFQEPAFRLRFARLVTHYWRHHAFLGEEQLIQEAPRLNGIPGLLIHGRYDVSSPLETPWRIAQRWEGARLQVLEDAGHGGGASFLSQVIEGVRQITPEGP